MEAYKVNIFIGYIQINFGKLNCRKSTCPERSFAFSHKEGLAFISNDVAGR